VTAATQPAEGQERKGNAFTRWVAGLRTRTKVVLALSLYLLIGIALGAALGSAGKNDEFQPQEEFKLEPWIPIHIGSLDLSINKAVLYLVLACALTCWAMIYVARRMHDRPNRVQTAVEAAYALTYNNITKGNMDSRMTAKWFVFVATLFFFIWFSNILGYLPLPTNDHEKVDVFGLQIPAFALYAATANLSIPLVLTLMVWFSYHVEGIRTRGFVPYLKSWIPSGVTGAAAVPIFFIEVISHFVRIISLSVRLFANILAGHLLILFMGGGLAVLLGLAAIGWFTLPVAVAFYVFEVGLIATLQAFIFATLTSIYLGGATSGQH
jgi:F-type H+-transporting ATPase subunit a